MADLTRDDIIRLAGLARIGLNDDEITEFADEFTSIFGYVQQLDNVDTSGLLPTSQVTGLSDVARDDVVIDYGYDIEQLMQNTPQLENEQIKVNRMIN